jgi:hypothetical protein
MTNHIDRDPLTAGRRCTDCLRHTLVVELHKVDCCIHLLVGCCNDLAVVDCIRLLAHLLVARKGYFFHRIY